VCHGVQSIADHNTRSNAAAAAAAASALNIIPSAVPAPPTSSTEAAEKEQQEIHGFFFQEVDIMDPASREHLIQYIPASCRDHQFFTTVFSSSCSSSTCSACYTNYTRGT
jgi:hypothetical protein